MKKISPTRPKEELLLTLALKLPLYRQKLKDLEKRKQAHAKRYPARSRGLAWDRLVDDWLFYDRLISRINRLLEKRLSWRGWKYL